MDGWRADVAETTYGGACCGIGSLGGGDGVTSEVYEKFGLYGVNVG